MFERLNLRVQAHQPLAEPRFLNGKIEPDQGERRRLGPENGGGPERTDHFIVPHVDDPHVAAVFRTFAGDGNDDMRVDGGERDVDDFKFFAGKSLAQLHFQITRRAIGRFGIPHRGRFAKNENANRIGRLGRRKDEWICPARQLRRKKSEAEILIIDQKIRLADAIYFEEARGMAVTGQPQSGFHSAQQQQWQDDHGDETEQPFATGFEFIGTSLHALSFKIAGRAGCSLWTTASKSSCCLAASAAMSPCPPAATPSRAA